MRNPFSALTAVATLTLLAGCELDGPPEFPHSTPPPAVGDPTPTPTPTDMVPEPTPEPTPAEPTPTPTPTPAPTVSSYPYGIPVPGKPGFVLSPHARDKGYVDVRGFPPNSEVRDPYSNEIFLVP